MMAPLPAVVIKDLKSTAELELSRQTEIARSEIIEAMAEWWCKIETN